MAKEKKSSGDSVSGRALVDIPRVGAKSGDYIELPIDEAAAHEAAGEFDSKARKPE